MGARVRPNDLAVGDPQLVVGLDGSAFMGRHDLGVAGMAQDRVHRRHVLAARRPGSLLDAQAEGGEPELGVAHEVEQLPDGRQVGAERDDLRQPATVHSGGQGGGAIPQAGLGHRADCSRRCSPPAVLDTAAVEGYISHYDIAMYDIS